MNGPWDDYAESNKGHEVPDINTVTEADFPKGYGEGVTAEAAPLQEEAGPWAEYAGGSVDQLSPDNPNTIPKPAEPESGLSKALTATVPGLAAVNAAAKWASDKSAVDLWTTESLPAHAINAYNKGVFDKPMGELVHNASDSVKDFSLPELWTAAKREPGKFAKELVKSVIADPELLFAPAGLGGRVAGTMGKLGTMGRVAGTGLEVGTASALMEAPINAAKQLDEQGFIDPAKLSQDLKVSFGFGAALGGVLGLGAAMGKTKPQAILDTMRTSIDEGADITAALEGALRRNGVSGKKAKELVKAVEPYRDEAALEKAAAQGRITSGEAKGFGEEPSALAARMETLAQKKVLTPSEAKELGDLQMYQQVLPELGMPLEDAAVLTPSQAKAWLDKRLPEAPLETFVKVEGPTAIEGKSLNPGWKQRGVLDPEMAKYVALTMGGAAVGGYLAQDKTEGAILGGLIGLAGPTALRAAGKIAGKVGETGTALGKTVADLKATAEKFTAQRNPHIALRVDDLLAGHEKVIGSGGLAAYRLKNRIKTLVPEEQGRADLIHVIQSGMTDKLPKNAQAAARTYQKTMQDIGEWGQREGVLDDLIEDGTYVTQLWKNDPRAKALFSSMKGETGFSERRMIPSYKKGIELGLTPKTTDLGEIAEIYLNNVTKAVANKRLLENLGEEVFADGRPALAKADAAPADYVPINHPQFTGTRVHPELAPSLTHLFYSTEIPAYLQAAQAVSSVAKRGIFSLSMFHPKSLMDVSLGVSLGLLNPKALTKIPSMYKMIREGKAGDFADQMVGQGLRIDPHAGVDMDNDVFRSMINTAEAVAKDLPIPGAHLPIKAVRNLDKGLQWLTWEYLHPSMKLATASAMYEKALLQQAKMLEKNPKASVQSPAQIQKEIAEAVNDLYGGLNWRQVAQGVETKVLHELASSLTNPKGLRTMRLAMLAPDWTVATMRAGYKGAGSTLKVLSGQKTSVKDQLYARAFVGGALMYGTIADALNMHFAGKHFWENDDPTSVDLGDGRKLQLSKHFMEPFHWLQAPGKAVLSKMGYLPKELLTQAMDKEYITKGGGPPMKDTSFTGRLGHALQGMAPITLQQTDPKMALSGFAGLPVYGKTDEETRDTKREKLRERREQRRSKERERRLDRRR